MFVRKSWISEWLQKVILTKILPLDNRFWIFRPFSMLLFVIDSIPGYKMFPHSTIY